MHGRATIKINTLITFMITFSVILPEMKKTFQITFVEETKTHISR
jgi:hypothetical protein